MTNSAPGQPHSGTSSPTGAAPDSPWRWARPVLYGLLLLVVDGLILDQGALSALVAAVLVLFYVPMTFLPRHRAVRKQRLMRFGLYMTAVLAVFAIVAANGALAAQRAERLIAAAEAFKAKRGQYPNTLGELVPEFAAGIPAAKLNFGDTSFRYHAAKDEHTLMYVAMPPFGRNVYRFEQRSWDYLD